MPIEEMIPETDQWKLEGDCTKCRRASYCHDKDGKGCRPLKNKRKEEKKAEAKKQLAEMLGVSEDEITFDARGQVVITKKETPVAVNPDDLNVNRTQEAPVDTNKTQSEE